MNHTHILFIASRWLKYRKSRKWYKRLFFRRGFLFFTERREHVRISNKDRRTSKCSRSGADEVAATLNLSYTVVRVIKCSFLVPILFYCTIFKRYVLVNKIFMKTSQFASVFFVTVKYPICDNIYELPTMTWRRM